MPSQHPPLQLWCILVSVYTARALTGTKTRPFTEADESFMDADESFMDAVAISLLADVDAPCVDPGGGDRHRWFGPCIRLFPPLDLQAVYAWDGLWDCVYRTPLPVEEQRGARYAVDRHGQVGRHSNTLNPKP